MFGQTADHLDFCLKSAANNVLEQQSKEAELILDSLSTKYENYLLHSIKSQSKKVHINEYAKTQESHLKFC